MEPKVLSYEHARPEIKGGDVVFVRGKHSKLVQSLIMFFTKSAYSHVGFAFWMTTEDGSENRLMMVEAQGGTKRRVVNMSFYEDRRLDVVNSPIAWNEIESCALSKLGLVEYGWLDVLYVGIHDFLLKYLGIKIPHANMPGETCSEFVAKCLHLKETHISPQELFEALMKQGCEIKIKVR